MKRMKKLTALLLAVLTAALCFSGCGLTGGTVPEDVIDSEVREYLSSGPFAGKDVTSEHICVQSSAGSGMRTVVDAVVTLTVHDGCMTYGVDYSGTYSRGLFSKSWTRESGYWYTPYKLALEMPDDPALWIAAAGRAGVAGSVSEGSSSECVEVIEYLAGECLGDYRSGVFIENDESPALQIYIMSMSDEDAASRLFYSIDESLVEYNGSEYFTEPKSSANYDYMEGEIYNESMSMIRCGDKLFIVDLFGGEGERRAVVYSVLREMGIEPDLLSK